jgi:hypothetical protein
MSCSTVSVATTTSPTANPSASAPAAPAQMTTSQFRLTSKTCYVWMANWALPRPPGATVRPRSSTRIAPSWPTVTFAIASEPVQHHAPAQQPGDRPSTQLPRMPAPTRGRTATIPPASETHRRTPPSDRSPSAAAAGRALVERPSTRGFRPAAGRSGSDVMTDRWLRPSTRQSLLHVRSQPVRPETERGGWLA